MLLHLSIRDVVLIDRVDLTFGPGLSALTGETGAGKSILLDALGLTMGARSDAGLVRNGAKHASVTATFDGSVADDLSDLLQEHGIYIESAEDLVLRRTVGTDGRSRAFVNDQPISIGLLRQIGDELVEIHGQFERFSLADPVVQRNALDAFGNLTDKRNTVTKLHQKWKEAVQAREDAIGALSASQVEAKELRGALEELNALDPVEGEEAELSSRRILLQNATRLVETFNGASDALTGDPGAETLLQRAARLLERDNEIAGGRLSPVISALDKANAELAEAVGELNSVAHAMDADPGELETSEERLFALYAAARRHGVTTDELPCIRTRIGERLSDIDDRDGHLEQLAHVVEESRRVYCEAGESLSKSRKKAAAKLDKGIAAELPPLKLENAALTTRLDRLDESSWAEHGLDNVSFEVRTNPGTSPGPLGKIASGGELSRIMLALKVVLAGTSGTRTIVFDEVDTGIGGATAAAVGARLAELANTRTNQQILVVTHSPQVAASARDHLRVKKLTDVNTKDGLTKTDVVLLNDDQRREEIARMLAGAKVTDEARAAADRLMRGENESKQTKASA
ncbi:MAG: DNA repair protein RecN [Alphaproteobacteria bacterium]|nr:DNA repair protein RecN [Alphaproteobacteria bacterium]